MNSSANSARPGIPRTRSPAGCDRLHRVNVALMPDERDELIRLAALDNRTYSAMARIYLIRGMQADPSFNPENIGVAPEKKAEGSAA